MHLTNTTSLQTLSTIA